MGYMALARSSYARWREWDNMRDPPVPRNALVLRDSHIIYYPSPVCSPLYVLSHHLAMHQPCQPILVIDPNKPECSSKKNGRNLSEHKALPRIRRPAVLWALDLNVVRNLFSKNTQSPKTSSVQLSMRSFVPKMKIQDS